MKRLVLLIFVLLVNNLVCIGAADSVLAPWIPLTVMEDGGCITVDSWGRKYEFDRKVLPTQIRSQNIDLLNDPISIRITENGQALKWSQQTIRVLNKSDDKVTLEGKAKVVTTAGEITLVTKIQIEYDGLMLISMTFIPLQNFPKTFVTIDIPYNNESARYFFKWERSRQAKYSGIIPNGNGVVMKGEFSPYYWTGDDYKGLFWFCESTNNWPYADQNNAIEYIRDGSLLVQRFNLGSSNSYNFGLQATPVKPLPNEWRTWHFASSQFSDVITPSIIRIDANPGQPNSLEYFGFPEAANPQGYKTMIENFHRSGDKAIQYVAITRLPADAPFFKENSAQWKIGKQTMKYKQNILKYVEPSSSFYAESVAKLYAQFMKDYHLDGYYLDGGGLYPNWTKAGVGRYFPIVAYRNLQREFYKEVKAVNPNAIIVSHTSADMPIPILAYVDAYLTGEQFRYRDNNRLAYKVTDSYLDVLSLEEFRIEFIGKQWGLIPLFLPQFSGEDRRKVVPTRGLVALLLQHDVKPFLANSNPKVWKGFIDEIKMFDLKEAEFIPYYDSLPPASTTIENLYVSAYKNKSGEILILISNLSKVKRRGHITLNLSRLGLPNIKSGKSLVRHTPISYVGTNVAIAIDALDYEMILIQ